MRIAFAEDDRQLRASIARGLREAGYTVDEATTGPELLDLVAARSHDIVLLDILLPEKDGLTVCRTLRLRQYAAPILMLTALDTVTQRIAGLDAGADDYLTKPFDFGELLARVRALTRRHGVAAERVVSLDGLRVDGARRTVHRAGAPVALTGKEFALLWHLVQHADRVVTRTELMADLWDGGHGTYSNIIDVYVGRLRRKLEAEGATPLIETVRGAGFRLTAPVHADA
jgi:two-component system, OmpR family, response regulator